MNGTVTSQFEPVRRAFENLWQHYEVGASLCVYLKGEKVVHLWGGWQDIKRTKPWQTNTLVNIYSTTKGIAALALSHLSAAGAFDYNDPVSDYWPEFGQNGKSDITIAMLLSHQAGLAGFSDALTITDLYEPKKLTALLASASPSWPPGTQSGYHVITWGFLAGELVRRMTGETLGVYLRDHITGPLGIDCHLGVSQSDLERCADLVGPNHAKTQEGPRPATPIRPAPTDLQRQAQQNPIIRPFKDACSKRWRTAEIPASNGHATAEGLAQLYAHALQQDGEGVGNFDLNQACNPAVTGQTDLILGHSIDRSEGGFILNPNAGFGPSLAAFGHNGAGGSSAFADRQQELTFAFVMNQMQPEDTAPRAPLLANCVYHCMA